MARCVCIPFSILGGLVCFKWATELYGFVSGLIALALWCSSPAILAYASLFTNDVTAASFGLLTAYAFSKWINNSSLIKAICAGLFLGLSLSSKMTWLIFIPVLPLVWLMYR